MTSMADGSSSTIMVDEWQPVFDRFDLESDGKMVLIYRLILIMMPIPLMMIMMFKKKHFYNFVDFRG